MDVTTEESDTAIVTTEANDTATEMAGNLTKDLPELEDSDTEVIVHPMVKLTVVKVGFLSSFLLLLVTLLLMMMVPGLRRTRFSWMKIHYLLAMLCK